MISEVGLNQSQFSISVQGIITGGIWSVNETCFTGFSSWSMQTFFWPQLAWLKTDHYQILVKWIYWSRTFVCRLSCYEKIVTIATNAEIYNCVIFCPIEGNLGRFFLHSEKNFYKFGCCGGLPWSMVTMETVSGNLFFILLKELRLNFFLVSKFFS